MKYNYSQESSKKITTKNNLSTHQQIVFIDSQVVDYQTLAAGVIFGIKVIVLDSQRDGIAQITEVLRHKPYSTVHIVSHGSPGCLYLGNTQLSLDTLNKYHKDLKTWSDKLSIVHCPLSILLYGCNVGAGDAGEEFITKLHNITSAEIAASTTLVGNADKGGNWNLDYRTTETDAELAFSLEVQQNYAGVLVSLFLHDFDSNTSLTWSYGTPNTATAGRWTIGSPIAYSANGANVQITASSPVSPSNALFTGAGADNNGTGTNGDVDGGTTTVVSSVFTLPTDASSIDLSFYYYFGFGLGNGGGGTFTAELIDDSDDSILESLVNISTTTNINAAWTLDTTSLLTHAGKDVYLEFSATDTDPGDVVEVGIDDVSVTYEEFPSISGTVFTDYDNDGTQELANTASEVGYENITVTAYFSDGSTATDTTDANGDYSITNTNSLAARVEFTLPNGYVGSSLVGADANTVGSVFFNDGTSQTANLGILDPSQYITNTSPTLVIPCYVYSGATGASSAAAIVTVLHSDSGDSSRSPNTETAIVTVNDVGAVNGLAYNKETEDLFAGAFQKRHSDVKNQNNGVIYRVDTNNSNAVNELIDLEDFFGANVAGAYSHDSANYDIDAVAFDAVGKVALGDVEISEDRQHIWTINLADRSLYKIEIGDGTKHTAGDGKTRTQYEILGDDNTSPTNGGIPLNDLGADPTTNIRPFALAQKDGLIYVGMINSAESTQDTNDLRAYVYTFDPTTETFSSDPVVDFALNYPRERKGVNAPGEEEGVGAQAEWDPWVSDFNDFTFNVFGASLSTANDVPDQTQPWLTDIEFDRNGNLILGLRDRTADQVGNRLPDPDGTVPSNDSPNNSPGTDSTGYRVFSGGDILRATPSTTTSGTWDIETINTETDEFYNGEVFNGHQETAQGGLLQLPGYDHVVTTALDPIAFNTGGLIKLSDTDGSQTTTGIELFNSSLAGNFAKANGLGDVEFFAELAPIEIGNRIWNDTDNDGIQDAGESGIDGVTVNLYNSSGTQVGTTTTNADGEYYFDDGNVTLNGATGLESFSDYEIRLDNTNDYLTGTGSLDGLNITLANVGSNDEIDSDAVIADGFPNISLTTGDYGENNYSYDFGVTSDAKDYGDAPDTGTGTGTGNYQTLDSDTGANHTIINGLSLGSTIDADDGTLQNTDATADDTDGSDDEDGITTFDTLATNTSTYSVDVDVTNTTGGDVTLIGWIDFDGNGAFDTDEEATATVANNDTTATLTWSNIPGDITAGTTYSRFRISSDALTEADSTGAATDGEVEDYQLTIAEVDYGDAPDTSGGNGAGDYTTTEANGGAFHIIDTDLTIGSTVDGDDGTLNDTTATEDDTTDTDDEDGITSFATLDNDSDTYSVDVAVTNNTGSDATLIGWIDFDGDGVFEADETATVTVSDGATSAQLDWSGLQSLADGINPGTTYARFRLSSDFNGITIDDNTSVGSASNGEVEDYQIEIKNTVSGTGAGEVINNSYSDPTTANADLIIGGAGQDTLTGGDGDDCFHFNRTSDGIDVITDFKANGDADKIDLSDLFATGGELEGISSPFNTYVLVTPADTPSNGTMIQVDFDGAGDSYAKSVVFLEGYDNTVTPLTADDFIF